MRQWFVVTACLSALVFAMTLSSCTSSYESKGNKAYKAAQRTQNESKKRLLEKEAYMYYRKAVKAHPDRIGKQLRNRFIESSLERARLVLTQGSVNMDALPLLMQDIDTVLSADVDPQLRTGYADFLVLLADSNFAQQKLFKALELINKSVDVAADPTPYKQKLDQVTSNLAEDNLEIAKMTYEQASKDKDHEALVRAEFRVKLAQYYNPELDGAGDLLSKLYEKNLPHYSAYEAVVEDKPDSNIYDQINKYDILLAIPEVKRGGGVTAIVNMYNYSYNPLRLRASDFALVDENEKVYKALSSSNLKKEILDQEHEVKMVLRFPNPKGNVKKLIYQNGEHYSEKNFF